MKRLLIFLLCSAMALSSLSFAAGAAESDTADTSAQADVAEEAAESDTAFTAAQADTAEVGATADEVAATGWDLLTETQFQSKLSSLRSKYPDGSIWEGIYYEYGTAKAWECWAYASQMMYEVFGARTYADRLFDYQDYNVNGITAGDWVRIDWDSHSIFITKVVDSGVYFTDGNGTGVYNQVRWDGYYSWSELRARFSYRLHLPGNNLTGQGVAHTVAYNANGGSGSMSSDTVSAGGGFTVRQNEFYRSGYTFAGYTVKRAFDNKWFTTGGKGWQKQEDIYNNGYRYGIYYPDESYYMSSNWLGDHTTSTTITFYAQWLPNNSTVEFVENYSGYNYMLGSDLDSGYDRYIYSRDNDTYNVAIDSSERLNNADSLRITGKSAGSSGSDLVFVTSTNRGYGDGFSPVGIAGDDKTYTLHFYAKASTDGAKMYFRWGYTTKTVSVTLSKSWETYSVELPKNRYCGSALHPYFDKAGTYYINSLSLGDVSWTSNVVPETGTMDASPMKVARGDAPDHLPTPKRPGYTFLGWYTAAEGGEEVTTGTIIDASALRLYAHWLKNVSYTSVKTVDFNGHRYELYDNAFEWEDADEFCAMMGGHLVTVGSAKENETVYGMIKDRQGYCWIGLNCVDEESDWRWVDDTSFSYKNWFDDTYGAKNTGEYYGFMYPMDYGINSYASEWDKCTGSSYFCSYYGYHNSFFICEYDTLLGDADGNSTVESIDGVLIQRKCSGLKTNVDVSLWIRGDVNFDGATDIIDVSCIQRYLAALETPCPVGIWT